MLELAQNYDWFKLWGERCVTPGVDRQPFVSWVVRFYCGVSRVLSVMPVVHDIAKSRDDICLSWDAIYLPQDAIVLSKFMSLLVDSLVLCEKVSPISHLVSGKERRDSPFLPHFF
jgi:hypothetical protein